MVSMSLMFQACQQRFYSKEVRWDQNSVSQSIPEDSSMLRLVTPYKEQLEDEMEQVIGQLDSGLYHAKPDGTLGRWIADALAEEMEEYTGEAPDFALHNFGGIRLQMIPSGPLTVGKIYETVPFDNALVDLSADSATVAQLVTHFMQRGGWPLSLTVDVYCTEEGGYRIEISGEMLSGNRNYHIAMPDYIANGGDDCFFLRDNPRVSTGYFVRDLIVEYIREETDQNHTLTVPVDRRIHCTKKHKR